MEPKKKTKNTKRDIEIGDVVVLNSSGPEMTVTSVDASGNIHAVWFPIGNNTPGGITVPAAAVYTIKK